jgi:acid ceramidase
MLVAGAPTYSIDLGKDELCRWAEVIAHERGVAERLIQEAATEFERVPELLRWVFAGLYRAFGGLYQGEIGAWVDALGVSRGTVTMLNCAYELSHLRLPRLFGCTAGVRWVEGLGMVHVRTLDWPLASMGDATRLFRFHRGAREFVSVGVPGHVGVLSGMLPGAYSATINWAPPVSLPTFQFGPAFLLRETLETCDSYNVAVRALRQTRLSTSVFFTVCGAEEGQACVIERTQGGAAVREMSGPALVQANHHVAGRFLKHNEALREVEEGEEEFSLEGSGARAATLNEVLAGVRSQCTLDEAAGTLDLATVLNRYTCQQMVFCPRSGDVKVWRRSSCPFAAAIPVGRGAVGAR